MKKTVKKLIADVLIITTLISIFALAGCGVKNSDNANADVQDGVTFTDALGRSVTVKSADRTASLLGSFSDVWLLAGGKLVASVNDAWDSLDLGLDDSVVKLGAILEPNVELLIASQPDFVIASANTKPDVEMLATLENAGITVAYFDVNNYEDYIAMLDICTDITGRKDLYEKNGVSVRTEVENAKKQIDGSNPKILLLRAASKNVKAKGSDGLVSGEILKDLGCVNIADSDSSLLDDLSLEAIVKEDPDFIFVTIQGTNTEAALKNVDTLLKSNPVWNSLTAVKNNRYYVLDKSLYNFKPNERWGEAYQKLADILY